MPLRLDSITSSRDNSNLIARMMHIGTKEFDSIYATPDKRFILMKKTLIDCLSRDPIGEMVLTLRVAEKEKQLQFLDMDIILLNDIDCRVRFLELKEDSSDANEYYEIETVDEGSHLIVETVNRHTEAQDLVDTERNVGISMFPFHIGVFKDMKEVNRWAEIPEFMESGIPGYQIAGLSDRFCMPGGMMNAKTEKDGSYSFVIGKVKSFRDVMLDFDGDRLPFVLAKVDTAAGVVPVAMGRDVFDLSKLTIGCIVAMDTVVKVDVAKPGVFRS